MVDNCECDVMAQKSTFGHTAMRRWSCVTTPLLLLSSILCNSVDTATGNGTRRGGGGGGSGGGGVPSLLTLVASLRQPGLVHHARGAPTTRSQVLAVARSVATGSPLLVADTLRDGAKVSKTWPPSQSQLLTKRHRSQNDIGSFQSRSYTRQLGALFRVSNSHCLCTFSLFLATAAD